MEMVDAGLVIDGTGNAPLKNAIVVIENGRIRNIRARDKAVREEGAVDARHLTLLPGLIDTHLHLVCNPGARKFFDLSDSQDAILLRAAGNAQAALRAGVTTVGDCGAPNELIFPLRAIMDGGDLVGPRMLASGAAIMPSNGHGIEFGRAANNATELRDAVRDQVAAGADFVKIMATGGGGDGPGRAYYTADELRVVAQEASNAGKRVAAHAHGTAGIRNAVEAGIQRIEHCSFYGDGGAEYDAGLAREIVARWIYVSPTNAIDYRRIEKGGRGAPREALNRNWRALFEAGTRFAASSDAGVTDMFYDDYALIPELMVRELGMTPGEALGACTRVAAETLGLETEIGTIQPGKCADVVAVRGNPLEDITVLRNVVWVMRNGRILHPS